MVFGAHSVLLGISQKHSWIYKHSVIDPNGRYVLVQETLNVQEVLFVGIYHICPSLTTISFLGSNFFTYPCPVRSEYTYTGRL